MQCRFNCIYITSYTQPHCYHYYLCQTCLWRVSVADCPVIPTVSFWAHGHTGEAFITILWKRLYFVHISLSWLQLSLLSQYWSWCCLVKVICSRSSEGRGSCLSCWEELLTLPGDYLGWDTVPDRCMCHHGHSGSNVMSLIWGHSQWLWLVLLVTCFLHLTFSRTV